MDPGKIFVVRVVEFSIHPRTRSYWCPDDYPYGDRLFSIVCLIVYYLYRGFLAFFKKTYTLAPTLQKNYDKLFCFVFFLHFNSIFLSITSTN